MKLILTADVANLGEPGDIVEVKDGYGRNYLLPRGLAIVATGAREKQVDAIRRARKSREIRDLGHAREVAAQLGGLNVTVTAKAAGDSGRLFGSVTASDVVDGPGAGGPALDRRAVEVPGQIKGRQAPGHGAPAPGGHHRAGRRSGRWLTLAITLREGWVRGPRVHHLPLCRLRTPRVTSRGQCPWPDAGCAGVASPSPSGPVDAPCGHAVRVRDTPRSRSLRRVVNRILSTARHPALSCGNGHKPGVVPTLSTGRAARSTAPDRAGSASAPRLPRARCR